MRLGDARRGKLAGNITAFGRALRRAGVRVDSARIVLAQQAVQLIGVDSRADVAAALEAVFVSRDEDRGVFREMFDAYFKDPDIAGKLLAQMLPTTQEPSRPGPERQRVREALSPPAAARRTDAKDSEIDFDAAMTASGLQRLAHADFNSLHADEYRLVEGLVRDVALPVPCIAARRTRPATRGAMPHWPGVMQHAARTGGELLELTRLRRREAPLPLLVLVDVSGSMERYSRLLLAFLHASGRAGAVVGRRDVFAFGTQLTDLTPAFGHADTDEMLAAASSAIHDFAGGTRLGQSLASLRLHHARRLVGGRTLVLLITDGLDTGEPAELSRELEWLRRHSRRLLWLNPLLRFGGYEPTARGAAVLHRHAHRMVAVHNLTKLQDLAASLAAVMKG